MHLSRTSLAASLVLATVVTCAIAVASATAAVGAPAARISVVPDDATPGKATGAFVDLSMSPRAPAPAKLVIYSPPGWGVPASGGVGNAVGSLFVEAYDQESSFGTTFGFGALTVGAAGLGTDATAQACAPGPHSAVWVATAKVVDQLLSLRFYVDQTSGDDASLGAYRITTCLPSPYVPPEQGGAPNGMQVTDLALSPRLANPAAAGTYEWRMMVTPYVPGTATADTANTFEARTHVPFPYTLTLRASFQAKTQLLVVSGQVLALGKPQAGVKVSLFVDSLNVPADAFTTIDLKDGVTRSDGTYRVTEPRKRMLGASEAAKLDISAFVSGVTGPCTEASVAPGGCTSDTLSPPTLPFPGVKLTIPAPKHH